MNRYIFRNYFFLNLFGGRILKNEVKNVLKLKSNFSVCKNLKLEMLVWFEGSFRLDNWYFFFLNNNNFSCFPFLHFGIIEIGVFF